MRTASYVRALVLAAAAASGCGDGNGYGPYNQNQHALETHPARLYLSTDVLSRLQTRAQAGDAAWTALRQRCDGWATGTMYPPSGPNSTSFPNVAAGYQGEDYYPVIMGLGLCYRVVRGVDPAAEARYGAAGSALLQAMSTPVAAGGQPPQTDDGYGIRNFGVGMATGFDWLYPALSSAVKQQVVSALNTWIDWFDQNGFGRSYPIGNYFTGYLQAKTTTALATDGDNANAAGYWSDVQNRLWAQMVQPAFSKNMKGGGFPEGWEYGARAVRSLAEFLWAVKTAKGLDWAAQLGFDADEASYLNYFAWPSLQHMDDQGCIHSGAAMQPPDATIAALAMIMQYNGDSRAAVGRSFAADVIAQNSGSSMDLWQKFLYWDDSLPKSPYSALPLSYQAPGPGHVAVRSSWQKDAVWGSLVSGPYIDFVDSGEQYFNQGSIAVVRGDQPLLVNATGWLPQIAGSPGEDFVYQDTWGDKTRKLYNTFFVNDANNPYSPGQGGVDANTAATHIERYEDQAGFVRARAAKVEDMYIGRGGPRPINQFTRDMVYLRPDVFVIYDRTTVAGASNDQWLSFHVPAAPAQVSTADATQRRYDINVGGTLLGSVRSLLPRSVNSQSVNIAGSPLYRLENHAPAAGAAQDWLTVVTASGTVPEQVRLSAADGNVLSGQMLGVHLLGARNQVVLMTSDHQAAALTSAVSYAVHQTADADHVLFDMQPSSSGYAVRASLSGGQITVTVQQGGNFQLTPSGTLSFVVSAQGVVSASAFGGTSGGGGSGGGGGGGGGSGGTSGGGGTPGNVLLNGSMETWSGGLPANWLRGGGPVVTQVQSGAEDGSSAAQMVSSTWGQGLYQRVMFPSARPAGIQITGQAYVKLVSGASDSLILQLVVEFADASPAQYINQTVPGWPQPGAWLPVKISTGTTHPVSAITFHIESNSGQSQTYQVDNATLIAQ